MLSWESPAQTLEYDRARIPGEGATRERRGLSCADGNRLLFQWPVRARPVATHPPDLRLSPHLQTQAAPAKHWRVGLRVARQKGILILHRRRWLFVYLQTPLCTICSLV